MTSALGDTEQFEIYVLGAIVLTGVLVMLARAIRQRTAK